MENFIINPNLVRNTYQQIFLQFPSAWLELSNPIIEEISEGGKRISGRTKSNWSRPEIGLALTNIEIILKESDDGNEIQIIEIAARQDHINNERWIAQETLLGSIIFLAENEKQIQKNDLPDKFFPPHLIPILTFFNFNQFRLQLHLTGFPELALNTNLNAISNPNVAIGNGLFQINKLNLNASNSYNSDGAWRNPLIRVGTQIKLAQLNGNLSFAIDHQPFYTIRIEIENGNDLSHILEELHLENIDSEIEKFNQELDLLQNIDIRTIFLKVNKSDLTDIQEVILTGSLTVFGKNFDIELSYNNGFNLSIRLNDPNSISFNDLFSDLLSEDIHFPFNPKIHSFRLTSRLSPLTYNFFISLTDLWEIPIGAKTISISRVSLRTGRNQNSEFHFRLQGIILVAGIDIQVTASKEHLENENGWLLETAVAHETDIHLTEFLIALEELFDFNTPDPENIPDVRIREVDLSFHTESHNLHFHVQVDLKSSLGPFKEGNLGLTINLIKNQSNGHDFSMDLNGFVEINEIHVDFLAENIGQKDWNASITYNEERHDGILTLENICKFFDNQFEIKDAELASLALAHFEIDYGHSANGDHTFYAEITLNTKNGKQITGFFSGQHADNKWNIAVGIGYEAGNHETTPEIITEASTHFTLESIWIIFINSSGTWPKLPDSFPAAIKDQEVTTGLGVVAKIDLDQHDFVGIDELTNRGHTVLDIFVEITNKGLRVEADLEGEFVIETGKNSNLIIEKASLVFEIGTTIALIIKGKFDLHIDGFEQTLEVGLLIKPDGFALFADLKFSGEGWTPFGIDGMHIDELAFELGVDFAPPAVLVGFMGFSHLGEIVPPNKLEDVQDEFAMVLGFSSEIPNPEYFALKITKLGLSDLLALFPGTSSDGHSVISDSTFSVKDFELIWCEKPLILPNGKSGEIGFSCHGLVEIFEWKAFASLEIHPDSGIQGVAMLEKLEIGPLKLTGKSPGLKLPKGVSNIKVTAVSADKSLAFDPNTAEMETIIAANGAFVQFNSSSSPYLNISFKLELLGITVAELNAEITDTKIEFDVALNLIIISINVTCILENTSEPYFNMTGEFFLGIDFQVKIDLLFVHIDAHIICGIGATIHLKEEKGTFTIGFSGRANFFGHEINMDEVSFSASIGDLKKLPEELKKIMNGEHTNNFSNDIKNASGHNNSSSSSSARFDMAHTLLLMATEWAQFVHADIQSLRHDLEKKSTEITELIKKIKHDITIINGSELAESHQDLNVEHTNHIAALSKIHKAAQPANADSIRLEDMKQMNNEIHWLADADNKLRNSINSVWKNFENELNTAETSFIIGLEDHVTGKISEEQLQTIRAKREQVITTIKDVILKLEDEQGKIYPSNAVQHHSLLIELENRMLLDSNEILTIARFQAENIIKNSIRPTDQEPFILTPTTHE